MKKFEISFNDSALWKTVAGLMDKDIASSVSADMTDRFVKTLQTWTNDEFLMAYLDRDPGFADVINVEVAR